MQGRVCDMEDSFLLHWGVSRLKDVREGRRDENAGWHPQEAMVRGEDVLSRVSAMDVPGGGRAVTL